MLGGPKKKQQQRPASGWSVVYQDQYLVRNHGISGDQPSIYDVASVLLPATSMLTAVSLEPSGCRRLFPEPEAESSAEVKNDWSCTSSPPIRPRGMQRDCK
jgi:hypothetical protein